MPFRLSHFSCSVSALAAIFGWALAAPADAQSLVANGAFEADIGAWSAIPPTGGFVQWSSFDSFGDPASGWRSRSRIAATAASIRVALPNACRVRPATTRSSRTRGSTASSRRPRPPRSSLRFAGAGCAGNPTGGVQSDYAAVPSGIPQAGGWSLLEDAFTAPVGTRSVRVDLVLFATADLTEATYANFDEVQLAPEPSCVAASFVAALALGAVRSRFRTDAELRAIDVASPE